LKNVRKDIDFIDCNASVTRSIYGENYYKIWGEERLKIRTAIEKKIIEDAKTLVFYNTVLPKQTGIKKFKFGLLYSTKFIKDIFPEELFLLRGTPKSVSPREFSLYITYLSLIAEYYFDVAKNVEHYFDIAKKYYNELFLLTLDVRYLSFIAYYYFLRNRYDLAEKEYKKILNYPMDKDAYVDTLLNLGVVYERQNKFNFAEECFYKATRLKPKYPQIYYNLGSLYLKVNKKNEAAKMFEEYIKLNPYDEKIKKYIEILKQGL
jgi:tetratricopeptide (TPR) repeat protein